MSDGEQPEEVAATPRSVGAKLRSAREAQGLTVADIAARTRVTQRFLEALEQDRLDLLPSPTYASGFARAYARAVDLDQVEIGRDIRGELARGAMPIRQHHIEEIADPSRGPSRGLVIVAAALALAVLVLGVLWLATGMFRGTGETPLTAASSVAVPAAAPAVVRPVPRPVGRVLLTAKDEVWMRVYDSADKTLFLGTMKPGQVFEVPANTDRPMINVGRPDQLVVTIDGTAVTPLGDGKRAIKDVGVSAEALRGRATPLIAPSPSASGLTVVGNATGPD